MNEEEKGDQTEDPYLDQVIEKIKITHWSKYMMSDLNDQLENHFSQTN